MGTICALTSANILMAEFIKIHLSFQKANIKLYLRFINNIFMIWAELVNKLKNFVKDLNTKHP